MTSATKAGLRIQASKRDQIGVVRTTAAKLAGWHLSDSEYLLPSRGTYSKSSFFGQFSTISLYSARIDHGAHLADGERLVANLQVVAVKESGHARDAGLRWRWNWQGLQPERGNR